MAVVTNAAGSLSSVASITSAVGLGVGGIFVSTLLIYLLAYFNIVDTAGIELATVRRFLVAMIVPLSIVFVGIVAFQTVQIV